MLFAALSTSERAAWPLPVTLHPGMDGPTFRKISACFCGGRSSATWERFEPLGASTNRRTISPNREGTTDWGRSIRGRDGCTQRQAHEQFGQRHIDNAKAASAYKSLLGQLESDLIFATTNYDRAGESALATLGYEIDNGFRSRPHRTPTLEPNELVEGLGGKTPVLHLHGAVGWYEKDGAVVEHHADQPYNPSLGTPVVLYPDPEKDPTNDAIVSQLWAEFHKAVEVADAIVVIGHSLHDPALARALSAIPSSKPVLVSFFSGDDADWIESQVPGAGRFGLDFAPGRRLKTLILQGLEHFKEHAPA